MKKIKNHRLALRAYKIRVKQYPYNKPLIDRNNLAFVRKENNGNRCDCFDIDEDDNVTIKNKPECNCLNPFCPTCANEVYE